MSHLSKLSAMPPVGLVVIVAIVSLFVLALLVLFITYARYSRLASLVGNLKRENSFLRFVVNDFADAYKRHGSDVNTPAIIANGVSMEFTIRKEFQNWITDSAEVFAIRDQNVISARVINIDVRRGKGRVLQDGDYLPPGKAQDIETVLETANELLGRVNRLIDAADTLLGMAMDTGTTVGALFGSRLLYDNLNRQLTRLDDITYTGMNALNKASKLMDTLQNDVPTLLNKVDTIATNVSGMVDNVSGMVDNLKDVPGHVNTLLSKLDTTVGRVDGMVDNIGNVSTSLTDFISSSEETLENADDLMTGMSKIWLIRRSIPSKDTVPFMVETLW